MSDQLKPGDLIEDKYRITAEIGQGGLGTVYRATDLRLSREVAIKILRHSQTSLEQHYGFGTFEGYLRRFEREARVSSFFTGNPHIITIYALEKDRRGDYYLVMEYLEGGSLAQLLKRQAPLEVEQTSNISIEICRALAEIHRHPAEIVHRDLKPSNILFRANGQAVVADFGIAQVGQESEPVAGRQRVHPGSPPYMSPEQRNSFNYLTPASDLYSLGLMIYEMLTAQMFARLQRLPPSLENPRIPAWLDELVIRLLHQDPGQRYQLAGEVAARFREGMRPKLNNKATSLETGRESERPKLVEYPFSLSFSALDRTQRDNPPESVINKEETSEAKTTPLPSSHFSKEPRFTASSQPDRSDEMQMQKQKPRMQLFISYQAPLVEAEEGKVVEELVERLSQRHGVFVDRQIQVNLNWARRIEAELRQANFVIVFLTAQTSQSEMVETEVATAYNLSKEQQDRPKIVPVRLRFKGALRYPLSAYLEGLAELSWQGPADTPKLATALLRILEGEVPAQVQANWETTPTTSGSFGLPATSYLAPLPFAQLPALELPEGTMDPQSAFYIERASDQVAMQAIQRQGVTITIKGPRQMGKSSLLLRVREAGLKLGKQVALLDFQLFDKTALAHPDIFYRQFCHWLTDELELENRVEQFWQAPLGNSQRATRYMQRHLLPQLTQPLVLAMDEVESIFDTPFRSDFFGMLRSWHNSRQAASLWKRLDLVLVTSTEPYQLIENLNQSPFNVGEVIELVDFRLEQLKELNGLYGYPLSSAQETQLMELLHGHPYLVRRSLYLIASGRLTPAELFSQATNDRGPFGDHLRNQLFRLYDKPELVETLGMVIQRHICLDERLFFRLRGAGLIRREGQAVVARCSLYEAYFRAKFLELSTTESTPLPYPQP
jgi:serine/threonine protein kinase